ncbi:hypothetical protein IJ732_04615 [bacterium]|nr:hypothetical protein [bacterium]
MEFRILNIEEEFKNLKKLLRDKSNLLIVLVLFSLLINICGIFYNIFTNVQIKKKIDHRYFNINQSLEDINNVDLNTKDGHIIRYR